MCIRDRYPAAPSIRRRARHGGGNATARALPLHARSAARTRSAPASTREHPFVARIVAKRPHALGAGHHVEIVRAISVRHAHWVVPAWHDDDVAVLDGEALVLAAVVGVDALEHEALRRVDTMVVGFLEEALAGQRIGIVLVRRIAR